MAPTYRSATPLQVHLQDREPQQGTFSSDPYARAGVATAGDSHIQSLAAFESSQAFLYIRQELNTNRTEVCDE